MEMKKWKSIAFIAFIGIAVQSCGGDGEPGNEGNQNDSTTVSIDTAKFMEDLTAIKDKIEKQMDIPKEKDLKEAIIMFQDFASVFPDSPEAPDYLLRASDICLTTKEPEKSVKILNRIIKEYPGYPKMEDVKYNKASHLDFELRDTTAAKDAYRQFIEEYPNSPLVKDCESRIENIRYSAEELAEKFIKELEENGGEMLP